MHLKKIWKKNWKKTNLEKKQFFFNNKKHRLKKKLFFFFQTLVFFYSLIFSCGGLRVPSSLTKSISATLWSRSLDLVYVCAGTMKEDVLLHCPCSLAVLNLYEVDATKLRMELMSRLFMNLGMKRTGVKSS